MTPVVGHYTVTSAVGAGLVALRSALRDRRSGLRPNDLDNCDIDTWIGRVDGLDDLRLPASLQHLHSRNNLLAWLALQQDGMFDAVGRLVGRLGTTRVGVVMGTSTSSIGRTEEAYRQLDDAGHMPPAYQQPGVHNLHSPGMFVAAATGIRGPSLTISTACSSSAKVFATAARWLGQGLVDAVLVGGADSLCLSTLYGFNALQLVSSQPCRPFDKDRDGINLGEAAGFAIVATPAVLPDAPFALLGYGESSDAWHMSHPHPDGRGACDAMRSALGAAGLSGDAVDYINLHGTASRVNDEIEAAALSRCFPASTLASSTKGWTGHTLGAAGILETVIVLDALQRGFAPGTLNCTTPQAGTGFDILRDNVERRLEHVMSNSFGFGGSNASLLFGHANG